MDKEKNASWLERVEEIIQVLEGSSVGELELSEGDLEITIRRQPNMVLVSAPTQFVATSGANGTAVESSRGGREDKSVAINAPLTGVYYSAASPSSPLFVNVGETVQVGQVVALVEAMKVFNEITAEVSGRVTALVATNGSVVQKGEVLLRVEPL
ncbi:acetyl-CoA carboxylase biotin carboxyl carrier protein subunit [Reticulibacter mediterranei]|uniref:Biotin carboxyl carrier protein of acetyl-CoA carboxylase n=1 Tax=Reticulibacter mediterranei TaxID=2778369 RepID=A0A8J3N2K8_9CHLR|nr:biotin/lipoyl-containing protein [Reticulibacter mediterranei]GHO93563.1 acetyl-CoA carboxylase biotin carboxyl carrier protein subunit [Reticulibacter mediterranei]